MARDFAQPFASLARFPPPDRQVLLDAGEHSPPVKTASLVWPASLGETNGELLEALRGEPKSVGEPSCGASERMVLEEQKWGLSVIVQPTLEVLEALGDGIDRAFQRSA